MTILCISQIASTTNYQFDQLETIIECSGFAVLHSSDFFLGLTYAEANQILAAVALLFITTFIVRLVLIKLGYT